MADPNSSQPRERTKRACRLCHSRRVRCNATGATPCNNCLAANVQCILIESRRGKHLLRHRRSQSEKAQSTVAHPIDSRAILIPPGADTPGVSSQHLTAPALASPTDQPRADQSHSVRSNHSVGRETGPRTSLSRASHPSKETEEVARFLGESSSLRLVHDRQSLSSKDEISPRDNSSLRYPLPDALKMQYQTPASEVRRKEARIRHLQSSGVFSLPPPSTCDILLRAYFQWFHICFPIVDRVSVMEAHLAGDLSPILFQAMLFIGVIFMDEQEFQKLGLGDRHSARHVFYNNAKDLYDANYEEDRLLVLQTVFLLSFWRAGPLLEKDTRHWLGVAISLAQTGAMHRNVASPEIKIRKRLWWCIYIRERQCSAALGLPNRIRDEDCDVELLVASDLEEQIDSASLPYIDSHPEIHVSYVIEITKLSRFLGIIFHKEYLPNSSLSISEKNSLKNELTDWQRSLPEYMKPSVTSEEGTSILVNMLQLAYNNLLILLFRSAYMENQDGGEHIHGRIALQAACRNTSIIENMLAEGTVQRGQVHLITSIFNSLCIHTITIRRSHGTARNVAQHRAKLCLLGLRELGQTWEVNNWVLHLFFQHLDNPTIRRLRMDDDEPPATPTSVGESMNTMNKMVDISSQPLIDPNLVSRTATVLPSWLWQISDGDRLGGSQLPLYNHSGQSGFEEFNMSAFDAGISQFNGLNSIDLDNLARCLL